MASNFTPRPVHLPIPAGFVRLSTPKRCPNCGGALLVWPCLECQAERVVAPPPASAKWAEMNDRGAYLPSPEEIAARAAELRAQRDAASQDSNGR